MPSSASSTKRMFFFFFPYICFFFWGGGPVLVYDLNDPCRDDFLTRIYMLLLRSTMGASLHSSYEASSKCARMP